MRRLPALSCNKGFTLLELLVVVVLIGLTLSMIITNIGDGGQQQRMEEEARRLTTLAKLARDEAVMLSREMAMSISDNQYAFEFFDVNTGWQSLQDDRIFKQHQLPDGLELLLEMEDFEFTPTRKKKPPRRRCAAWCWNNATPWGKRRGVRHRRP